MYAIVDIGGKQFKVTQDQFVYAPLMEGEDGASVEFDKVLLFDNDGKVEIGAPLVKGATVSGKILGHVKGDKVIVFKKKRRKGYKKKNGHRQNFTKVMIDGISLNGKKANSSTTTTKAADKKTTKKEDDLSEITGIGPVYSKELNKLGFTAFEQIANLTEADKSKIAEVDGLTEDLIESEEWVKQAKALLKKKK